MILRIAAFNDILLDSNYINVLEIEDKKLFASVAAGINDSVHGKDIDQAQEPLVLLKEEKIVDMSRDCLIYFDLLNIDFNDKKILTKLNQNILNILNQDIEEKQRAENLLDQSADIIRDIVYDFDFTLEMNESVKIEDFLKILGIKIDIPDTLMEKLCLLTELISCFKLCDLLVLVNAKCYFDTSQINQLYKHIMYKNITVLFLEHIPDALLPYERKVIIDSDFYDTVYVEK